MSYNLNADLLAAQSIDLKDWVVALRHPRTEETADSSGVVEGAVPLQDEKKEEIHGTVDKAIEKKTLAGDIGKQIPQGSSGASASPKLSLEERITVVQLRELMEAFAVSSDAFSVLEEKKNGLYSVSPAGSPRSPQHTLFSPRKNNASSAAAVRRDPPEENLLSGRAQSARLVNNANTAIGSSGETQTKKYDKALTSSEFVEVVTRLVPSATEAEVEELMNKVDYDGRGKIAWDELSTFLTSQSRRREYLANVKLQFLESPEPPSCAASHLHQQILCYTIERSKNVILTGGVDGTVRAWGTGVLSYRGLIFSCDSWIMGIHFSEKGRVLYVCTLDRRVFILDGSSYEVQKVFRGRATGEKVNKVQYAINSSRTVRVGGVAFHRRADKRSAAKNNVDQPFEIEQLQKKVQNDVDAVITPDMALKALCRTDTSQLTEPGTGPYVERLVDEGTFAGVIDNITSSLYHCSKLSEECLLLGTSGGAVYFFRIDLNSSKSVYTASKVMSLHTQRVNKMELFYPLNALISASDDGSMMMVSMATGKTMYKFNISEAKREGERRRNGSAGAKYVLGGTQETIRRSMMDEEDSAQHSCIRDFVVLPRFKNIVTIGTERYALVWDMASERVVATLQSHSSPLKCCTANDRLEEIVTISYDGTVNFYDCNGYQLVQRFQLDRPHWVNLTTFTPITQSLLCFGRYPFELLSKRQATTNCPANYSGHFGTMFTTLYSKVFGQVVTIDNDALAMTWLPETGKSVFSYVFNDFSDSVAMDSARLTCACMDGLQRRILTGFNNGAVVAWNAVNGQPINFITAALPGATKSFREDSDEDKKIDAKERPWRVTNRESTNAKHTVSSLDAEGVNTGVQDGEECNQGEKGDNLSEISSIGSLVRRGATFFLFSVGRNVYTARESSDFTIASASRWSVPEAVSGVVTTMTQVGEHIMALGMSSGCLLFYHVLSERLDGQPLFSKDFNMQTFTLGGLDSAAVSPSNNGATLGNSFSGGLPLNSTRARLNSTMTHFNANQPGTVTANVSRVITLPKIDENIFLSIYSDGTVALWQTFRRLFLGSLNLMAATSGEESKGADVNYNLLVDVDENNEYLVFSDESGNVHVCALELQALQPEEEHEALLLRNAFTYFPSRQKNITKTDTSLDEDEEKKYVFDMPPEPKRTIFIPKTFKRIGAFGTGLGPLTSILIISKSYSQDPDGGGDIGPIIVCTGLSRFTRVFNLRGEVMGELGMHTWDAHDPSTFRKMNERRAPGAPPTILPSSMEQLGNVDLEFDYLEDLLITEQITQYTSKRTRKSRKPSSGSTVLNSSVTQGTSTANKTNMETTLSKATGDSMLLADALKTLNAGPTPAGHTEIHVDTSGDNGNNIKDNIKSNRELVENMATADKHLLANTKFIKDANAPSLSTVMQKSTRQRYLEEPKYRGLIKKDFAAKVRQQTVDQLSGGMASTGDGPGNNSNNTSNNHEMSTDNISPVPSAFNAEYFSLIARGYTPNADHEGTNVNTKNMDEELTKRASVKSDIEEIGLDSTKQGVRTRRDTAEGREKSVDVLTLRNRDSVSSQRSEKQDQILLSPNRGPLALDLSHHSKAHDISDVTDSFTDLPGMISPVNDNQPIPSLLVSTSHNPSETRRQKFSNISTAPVSGRCIRSAKGPKSVNGNPSKNVQLKERKPEDNMTGEELAQRHLLQFRTQINKAACSADNRLPPEYNERNTNQNRVQLAVKRVIGKKSLDGSSGASIAGMNKTGTGRDNYNYLKGMYVAPINSALTKETATPPLPAKEEDVSKEQDATE